MWRGTRSRPSCAESRRKLANQSRIDHRNSGIADRTIHRRASLLFFGARFRTLLSGRNVSDSSSLIDLRPPSSRSGAGAVVNHRSPTKSGDSGVRPRAALILGSVPPRLSFYDFPAIAQRYCLLSPRKSRHPGFRVTVTREDLRRVRERGKREKERKENKVKNRVELGVAARETINKTIINFPIYF